MSNENLVLLVIAFALGVAHAAVSGPLAHAIAAGLAKLGLRSAASPGSARSRFVAAAIVVAGVLVALVALERAHAHDVACEAHATSATRC